MKISRGFLTGSILGAVAGMMILPQLNKRTRNQVNKASKMVMDKASDIINQVK